MLLFAVEITVSIRVASDGRQQFPQAFVARRTRGRSMKKFQARGTWLGLCSNLRDRADRDGFPVTRQRPLVAARRGVIHIARRLARRGKQENLHTTSRRQTCTGVRVCVRACPFSGRTKSDRRDKRLVDAVHAVHCGASDRDVPRSHSEDTSTTSRFALR